MKYIYVYITKESHQYKIIKGQRTVHVQETGLYYFKVPTNH